MTETIRTAKDLQLDKLYAIKPTNKYRCYIVNEKEICLPFNSGWTIETYLTAHPGGI